MAGIAYIYFHKKYKKCLKNTKNNGKTIKKLNQFILFNLT